MKRKLDDLNASPLDPRLSKELTGHKGVRSARVGDWRILFLVEPYFFIVRIEHRRDVYRRLGILPRRGRARGRLVAQARRSLQFKKE